MEKFAVAVILYLLCLPFHNFAFIPACYHCKNVDDIDLLQAEQPFPFPVHSSCSTEHPKGELLIDCADYQYDIFGRPTNLIQAGSIPSRNDTPKSDNDQAFYCVKLTFDGNQISTNIQAKMTIRSCISNRFFTNSPRPRLPQECEHNTKLKIGKQIYDAVIRAWIQEDTFDGDTDMEVCTCNKPGCNGATRHRAGILFVFPLMLSVYRGLFHSTSNVPMAKFTVMMVFLIFCSSYITGANALQCYHCKYVEGIDSQLSHDAFPQDESCGSNEPKEELGINCEILPQTRKVTDPPIIQPIKLVDDDTDLTTESEEIDNEPGETTYSCIQINYTGKHKGTDNKIKMIVRSCVVNSHVGDDDETDELPEVCYNHPKDRIIHIIKYEHIRLWMRETVEEASLHFAPDVNVNICTCHNDECNGAMRYDDNSIAPLILVISALMTVINCKIVCY
ncbi:hypothetical protein Ocin01_08881 [Orchesella cincta]|uniref:Protein quiver n=1 Tax=Orchesella cincta TaxID=48709 RepID=A0A1D2MXQ8_ORCCI|nr:hypothetical protein Ocin01_08881 [Orchesella cincta]